MRRAIPFAVAATAAAVALLGASCDDSSPTEPRPAPQPPARVVITDPAGAFAAHHQALRDLIEQTVTLAGAELPVGSVTFEVVADRVRAIPNYGIGGYTLGPSRIEIVVDPAYPDLGSALTERIPPVVAHELHHAVRWRGPGPYSTLLEALVFEGLADRFAIELLGTPLQPWSDAFPESDTARYLDLARPELDSFFDFRRWFLDGDAQLPPWTGYTLGFRLVAAHQQRTGRSAAELVNTPAEAFRPE